MIDSMYIIENSYQRTKLTYSVDVNMYVKKGRGNQNSVKLQYISAILQMRVYMAVGVLEKVTVMMNWRNNLTSSGINRKFVAAYDATVL